MDQAKVKMNFFVRADTAKKLHQLAEKTFLKPGAVVDKAVAQMWSEVIDDKNNQAEAVKTSPAV